MCFIYIYDNPKRRNCSCGTISQLKQNCLKILALIRPGLSQPFYNPGRNIINNCTASQYK